MIFLFPFGGICDRSLEGTYYCLMVYPTIHPTFFQNASKRWFLCWISEPSVHALTMVAYFSPRESCINDFCWKPTSWDPPWRDSKGCGFTYPFFIEKCGKMKPSDEIRGWILGRLFGTQSLCKPKSSMNKVDLFVNNLDLLFCCLEKVNNIP